MSKLITAYILGVLSFVMAITGPFSLILSVPGLILAIGSLKLKGKDFALPIGYKGKFGGKRVSAQPYISTRYLSYTAIVLNVFSMAVSLFAAVVLAALFTAGTR